MADWSVYVLKCNDSTLYTGVTTNLDRRLRQHNGETKGGAKYTRARRPCVLVYSEVCENRSKAQIREAEIKRLSRAKKLELIA